MPGSKSITPPVNTGGWLVFGQHLDRAAPGWRSGRSGSVAEVPSVTWNEIDAGPKYCGAEVNCSVWLLTTSDEPSECVARDRARVGELHLRALGRDHVLVEGIVSLLPLTTVSGGAVWLSCGSASSVPGTQMNA